MLDEGDISLLYSYLLEKFIQIDWPRKIHMSLATLEQNSEIPQFIVQYISKKLNVFF